jgi:hypothetical protein
VAENEVILTKVRETASDEWIGRYVYIRHAARHEILVNDMEGSGLAITLLATVSEMTTVCVVSEMKLMLSTGPWSTSLRRAPPLGMLAVFSFSKP